jgi:RND family efflux transporter MFP subunit
MKRTGNRLASLLLLTLAMGGCGRDGEKAVSATRPTVGGVTLETPGMATVPEQYVAVGTVRAVMTAQVAARLAGTVTRVTVREGDRVASGILLVAIEAAEQAAGAAAAQAGTAEALKGLEEARARQRLAETSFARFSRLFEERAATRQELDSRQADLDVATQGVARAEARLQQAREGARAAEAVAGYARVKAPIAGVVTTRSVEPGVTVFPGTPLVSIEGQEGFRLEASVPEGLLAGIRVGQAVPVAVDGGRAAASGRVAEIVPAVDPATRTALVKVDLAGSGLKGGMFGRATFPVASRPGLMVPRQALVARGALTSVWVVDTNRIARLRLIKPGRELGDRVEVLAGLSAGETIVVSGVEKVTDGARIE